MVPGFVLEGRFTVEALAGKGGMSAVYRARDRQSGRLVAVKVFDEREERAADRFTREIELLASLQHPGIVEHVAHGTVDGKPFLALEWLDGEDLAQRLTRGPLGVEETIELGRCVADALSAAHARGIVHRDVKPANIFLSGGALGRAKLIDFGIARVRGGAQFTRFGEALGTPAYMAPEQARGSGGVDARADVFALGCVLYECLTGRPPFWADHPLAVMAKILLEDAPKLVDAREDVPLPLASLVQRMLAKEPAQRPADGAAVSSEIAKLLGAASRPIVDEPSVMPSSALTSRELQLLSVVFVGRVEASVLATHESYGATLVAEPTTGQLDRVITEVLRYGGWAERLVDGSVVVTLPGRGAILEQAASAARCALAVQRAMTSHPMALVTGRAEVTGGFPVGEVVERGVRLLAAEKARFDVTGNAGIAIDDVAASLLDRRFEIETSGSALRLVRERPDGERVRTLLGKPQPFVGRDRELRRVLALYETCVADRAAQAMLVTAKAGFGKSRLGHEVVLALEGRQFAPTILIARADPDRRQVELGVMASAFRHLFGLQEQEPPEVALHRVRSRVGRCVPKADRERVAVFLGELVGVHFPVDAHSILASVRSDRVRLGDQIRAACEDFLAAELADAPDRRGGVVVLLEDMHQADAATLAFLDGALRSFADAPLFVLGLAKPEVDELFPRLWPNRPLVRFELPRLPVNAAASLARHALGEEAPDATIDRIVAQADGNAFYLEELVRAVAGGRTDRLPETVLAVLQARLDELDAADRRVLRACSVFGDSFTIGGVRALLGPAEVDEVAKSLERLVDVELLASPGSNRTTSGELGLVFRSAIVREAAYASLTEEDRSLGHRLAAGFLERAGADRDAIVVANHLVRAGDEARAAAWFARAAELAFEGNDFAAAVERAERGVPFASVGPLLGRIRFLQSEAHRHMGSNAEMLACAEQALEMLPRRTPPWWGAAANAIVASLRLGRRESFERHVAEVTGPPYENLPAAATRAAHYLHFSGKPEVADPIVAAALTNIGAFAADPSKWAWGYRAYATRAIMTGDIGDCVEQLGLAIRAFDAAGDMREVASQRIDLAGALLELGMDLEARAALRESQSAADKLGLLHASASVAAHLGAVEGRLGRWVVAQELFERAIRMFSEQKNRRMEGLALIYRARALLDEGKYNDGLEVVMHATQLATATPQHVPYALAIGAQILLRAGREREALPMMQDAMEPVLAGLVVDEGDAFVRLTYAESLLSAGRTDEGTAFLRAASERLMTRASRIRDAAWRKSFLENVPENARTIELASSVR